MTKYFVTRRRWCLFHFVKFSVTSWKNHNGSVVFIPLQSLVLVLILQVRITTIFTLEWELLFARLVPRISQISQISHRVLCLIPRHSAILVFWSSAIPPFRLVSSVFRSAILVSRDSKGGKSPSFSCNEPCSPSFSTFRVYIHINTESPNIF